MDNMFILMDMLVVGCGVYVLYAFYLMKAKGEVKESLLLSNGAKMAKCKDKNAYMAYISPRLLIFGLATIICGGLGVERLHQCFWFGLPGSHGDFSGYGGLVCHGYQEVFKNVLVNLK